MAFTEGDTAKNVTTADATVTDVDDTSMVSFKITAGSISDSASEIFTIGGTAFPQDADKSSAGLDVGGTNNFDITYTQASGEFAVTRNGGGEMLKSDIDLLIQGITYENTSENPTAGARTLTFITNDGDDDSNQPVSTITVTAANDPPDINLDPDNSGGGVDNKNFEATFTQNGLAVYVADVDAAVTDADDTTMVSLTLTAGSISDGADEVFTIGGTAFPQSTDKAATVTAGSTSFDIAFTNSTGIFNISKSGGGEMPVSDIDALIQDITYENTSSNPTTGARMLNFVTNDGDTDSNTATSTITVNARGTITGTVFDDLDGNMTKAAGESGIAGVTVELVDSGDNVVKTATTGADGSYTITDIIPSTYTVRETDLTGYTSSTSNSVGVNIIGGTTTVNFGDLKVGTVSGTVYDDLAGVTVTLTNTVTGEISETVTNSDGSYSFSDVGEGSYTVTETDPDGFASTTPNSVPVTISGNGSATANFGDMTTASVSGMVFNDTDGDGVPEADETGLAGVTVTLTNTVTGEVSETITNSDGSYSFSDVGEGSYTVTETDPDGFASTTPNSVPVTISGNGSATANFGDMTTGSVSGMVFNDTDGDGIPEAGETGLGGVTVKLTDTATGEVVATTVTASDGSYSFGNIGEGSYTATETDPEGFTSTTPNSVPVTISGNGSATANFGDQGKGTVSGKVFNDFNGDGTQNSGENGLSGVTIELIDKKGNITATTTTSADGSYSFSGVPAGGYTARETDPEDFVSTTPNEVSFTLLDGGAATANFGDQTAGTISGKVFNDFNGDGTQNPGENGLSNVTVELVDESGQIIATVTTVADGSYSFADVEEGSYTVQETDPEGFISTTSNSVQVSLPSGESGTANFGDHETGTVSGKVFNDTNGNGKQDSGENGLGSVTVELVDESGQVIETVTTVADGSYSFADITEGVYTIRETDPTGFVSTTDNEVTVSVSAGGAGTANFGDQQEILSSITGIAWDDVNGNGTQDQGESGLGGVTIELLDSEGNLMDVATTAADGTYVLEDVIPGAYTVQEIDPDGYTSTTNNKVTVSVSGGVTGIADFGDRQAGVVSGTVYNDINGNGTRDTDEDGIGGVTVELTDSEGNVVETTTTLEDGSYSFADNPEGTYTVKETDPQDFNSTTPNSVSVNVPSGGSASANFGDQPKGTVSGTVFNDTDGNGVQDTGEEGIEGVTVELLDEDENVVATTTTDEDGTYAFTDIPEGSYTVKENDPDGYSDTSSSTIPVNVPADGSANADFGEQQKGTVSGNVFNDTDGDGKQDPGENGIGGTTVELVDENGKVVATTVTDENGSYTFTGVPEGTYTVRQTDPSGLTSTTPNTIPVVVPSDGSAVANFGEQQEGSISGKVFNDINGNGVQDPGEYGIGGTTVDLADSDGNIVDTVTTAEDGSYIFTNVPEGTYTIQKEDIPELNDTTPGTIPVSVAPGGAASANFGEQPGGSINGDVFNDTDGDGIQDPGEQGIGGVTVELVDSNGNVVATTTTSPDGSYSFTGVQEGSYTVRELDSSDASSTTPNTIPVTVDPGSSATADFGEQQKNSISGFVFNDLNGNGIQDPDESGIGGVITDVLDSGGNVVATATTIGNGAYIITDIPEGTYIVRETDPDGLSSTTPNEISVDMAPDSSASANFGDQQKGTVSGYVFNDINGNGIQDSGEDGIGGVTVQLLDADGNIVKTVTSVGNGSYIMTGVPAGSYTVQETDPQDFTSTTPNTIQVDIDAEGAASANFGDQTQSGSAISGFVFYDVDGNGIWGADEPGIANANITLIDSTGTHTATVTTDTGGAFSFDNIESGTYTVQETDLDGYVSTTPNTVTVTTPSDEPEEVLFGDRQQGNIIGSVFDDLNGNGKQNQGESGLPGVTVQLLDTDGNIIAESTTDQNGDYIFENIPPGTYTVRETDPEGYISTTPDTLPLVLQPGTSGIANFGDHGKGSITGVVFNDVDGDGVQEAGEEGIPGVTVELTDSSGNVIPVVTDDNGTYVFDDIIPGTYTLKETDPDGYISVSPNTLRLTVSPGGGYILNFGDLEKGSVNGVVFSDVNGNGTHDTDENGLPDVQVELLDAEGNVIDTTYTDADGDYMFPDILSGTYTVRETNPDNFVSTTPDTVPVTLESGGSGIAIFGDIEQGSITGVVFNDVNGDTIQSTGEKGIAGIVVELLDSNGNVAETATTDINGVYEFTNVNPGDYTVQETDPSGFVSTTPNEVVVTLQAGGAVTTNFGDREQGSISGTVFSDTNRDGIQNSDEKGLFFVTVKLTDNNGNVVETATTDANGIYQFINVTPGDYTIQETDPSGFTSTTPNEVPVTLLSGESLTVSFGDYDGGTISGIVFNDTNSDGVMDADEQGLGSVTVELADANGNVIQTVSTDAAGNYIFTNVSPDNYIVRETDPSGFISTTPNEVPVTLSAGQASTASFGDQGEKGSISGVVFDDINGNGIMDSNEVGLNNVTVELADADGNVVQTVSTYAGGSYVFTNVSPGDYTIRESDPAGFISTTPNEVSATLTSGGSIATNFGDQAEKGSISGFVFDDINSNGIMNAGHNSQDLWR
ncbi:MAG: Cna B-type domain-containing protein [Desulfobacteraceae bacterium]|nr:Cna B-type domain-containing protein [Desulfobacteraceae bacterium]